MAVFNRTLEFRDIVKEKERNVPEAKRRKLSRSARRTGDDQRDVQETLNKEYMAEGYNLVRMSSTPQNMSIPKLKCRASLITSIPSPVCLRLSRNHISI